MCGWALSKYLMLYEIMFLSVCSCPLHVVLVPLVVFLLGLVVVLEGDAVDTVSEAGGGGTVAKHVAKMSETPPTVNFSPENLKKSSLLHKNTAYSTRLEFLEFHQLYESYKKASNWLQHLPKSNKGFTKVTF